MGKEFMEVDFGAIPQNLQEEYLDVYEWNSIRYSEFK